MMRVSAYSSGDGVGVGDVGVGDVGAGAGAVVGAGVGAGITVEAGGVSNRYPAHCGRGGAV